MAKPMWGHAQQFRYSGDDTTYRIAGAYLSGPGIVEDWGCGTSWARPFIGAPYVGVDGYDVPYAAKKAMLTDYTSHVPKILMRHVLEHNYQWRKILRNMVASFTDRACLVLFIPPGPIDKELSYNETSVGPDGIMRDDHWPNISLCEPDLHDILDQARVGFTYEDFQTDTPWFNFERVYFIEKGTDGGQRWHA